MLTETRVATARVSGRKDTKSHVTKQLFRPRRAKQKQPRPRAFSLALGTRLETAVHRGCVPTLSVLVMFGVSERLSRSIYQSYSLLFVFTFFILFVFFLFD